MNPYTEREQTTDSDSWPEPREFSGSVTVLIPVEFYGFTEDAAAAMEKATDALLAKLRAEYAEVELIDTDLDGTDADERGVAL